MATVTQETNLAVYGGRDEVKELGLRLRTLMPSAQNLTDSEAMSVAQIAVAHRLDPFNGEVWGIKGDGKWYGVMVGIKGLRKCSNRQAAQENTVYWKEFISVSPEKYGEAANAVVFECTLRDTATMQAYSKSLSALVNANIPYKEAVEMIGKAPGVVGVGIATPAERSKMKITQRAKKRAEADALKQRFDVEFGEGVVTEGEHLDGEVMEIVENTAPSEAMTDLENIPAPQAERHDTQQSIDEMFPTASTETQAKSLSGVKTSKAMPRPKEDGTDDTQYRYNDGKIVAAIAKVWGCEAAL